MDSDIWLFEVVLLDFDLWAGVELFADLEVLLSGTDLLDFVLGLSSELFPDLEVLLSEDVLLDFMLGLGPELALLFSSEDLECFVLLGDFLDPLSFLLELVIFGDSDL